MSSKVKVVVRIRPSIKNEPQVRCVSVADGDKRHLLLRNLSKKQEVLRYRFDSCYDTQASQEDIFSNDIEPLISNVLKGLNTTVFAYGNTGAGKTYTMQGTDDAPGIIPRTMNSIISSVQEAERTQIGLKHSIHISYLELYNEKVYDLLVPKKNELQIHEDQDKNIKISDLAEIPITSAEEFKETYEKGCQNRTTGFTKLNATSSRSHAVLIIKVQHREANPPHRQLIGKFHLIDLAGSEDNRRTDNKGIRLTESANINQSLFVLGNVVNALNSQLKRIPYRDSKLTRLLQDSLGGNSFAVMVTNIAPGSSYFTETFNTISFASKSKKITNKPTVHAETEAEAPVVQDAEALEARKAKLEEWKRKRKGEDLVVNKGKAARYTDKENVSETRNQQEIKALKEEFASQILGLRSEILSEVNKGVAHLRKDVLSPLTKTKLLQEETHERIGKLQQTWLRKAEQETNEILEDDVDYLASLPHYHTMTPASKVIFAKPMIAKGREFEKAHNYEEALKVYKTALVLLPEQSKLVNKIATLEQELRRFGSSVTQRALQPLKQKPYASPVATPYATSSYTSSSSGHGTGSSEDSRFDSTFSGGSIPPPNFEEDDSREDIAIDEEQEEVDHALEVDEEVADEQEPEAEPEEHVQVEESTRAEEPKRTENLERNEVTEQVPKQREKKRKSNPESSQEDEDEEEEEQSPKRKRKNKNKVESKPQKEDRPVRKARKTLKKDKKRESNGSDADWRASDRSAAADSSSESSPEPKAKAKKNKRNTQTLQYDEELAKEILVIINRGKMKELKALKGIGAKRAEKIIAHLEDGPIRRIDDLRSLGFNDKIISSLLETQL